MFYQQLPAWMDDLRDFLPSKMASVLSTNISVHLRVPPESRPVLTVNGYKMVLGSAVGTRLQSWLINTQFPSLLQFVTDIGIVGKCIRFSSAPLVKSQDSIFIMQQLLPLKSYPIHYSPVFLPFDGI
jgi:hypothetical protein